MPNEKRLLGEKQAIRALRAPERIHREVLPNGLTLLLEEMDSVRSASLGFWIRRGSADEPSERAGATHFIEHLVFKRTKSRTNRQIAQLIDRLGGDVDAFTSKEYTAFYARVEARKLGEAVALLADIVKSPAFDRGDIERERKVILEEIAMVEDTPDDLVHETFIQQYWKGHPLGRPVLGTPATIGAISPEHVAEIYGEAFVAPNLIFAASGAIDSKALAADVRATFGDLGGRAMRRRRKRPVPKPHLTVRKKGEMEQVQLLLGFEAPEVGSPDRFAATLLNVIMGGGMSSRLFHELREQRGLVYSCGSFWSGYSDGGYECVYAASRRDNLEKVLHAVTRILRKLVKSGVTRAELSRAKESVVSSFLLGLESTSARMSGLARQEFHFGEIHGIDEIVGKIEAVTPDDVREVARQLFRPETAALTVLGSIESCPLTLDEIRGELAG